VQQVLGIKPQMAILEEGDDVEVEMQHVLAGVITKVLG
jgi:hypothetical protein